MHLFKAIITRLAEEQWRMTNTMEIKPWKTTSRKAKILTLNKINVNSRNGTDRGARKNDKHHGKQPCSKRSLLLKENDKSSNF